MILTLLSNSCGCSVYGDPFENGISHNYLGFRNCTYIIVRRIEGTSFRVFAIVVTCGMHFINAFYLPKSTPKLILVL
jgi:hypothetical protein